MSIFRKKARCSFIYGMVVALFVFSIPAPLPAYSVLTHEQVVDFLWHSDIVKLLREQYPNITPEQLREAHAYPSPSPRRASQPSTPPST